MDRKANAICFSAHATDTSHAAVQGFIRANGKISRGTVAQWLKDSAIGDIGWTVTGLPLRTTTAARPALHIPPSSSFSQIPCTFILKQPVFNNRWLPQKVLSSAPGGDGGWTPAERVGGHRGGRRVGGGGSSAGGHGCGNAQRGLGSCRPN
jgi:hypothetical protein